MHDISVFSTYHPDEEAVSTSPVWQYETMRGFVTEQAYAYSTENKSRAAEAINYYTPEHLPVFSTMAENFVLFDRWFCSVPGPTNPNRAYISGSYIYSSKNSCSGGNANTGFVTASGTSHGHGKNDDAFDVFALPQKSIFELLSENGISWTNYQNSTTGPG